MDRPKASKLAPEQREVQRRLQKLLDESAGGIQALVAADLGISPSAVNQQVSGHRPLNLKTAVAFARRLHVELHDISRALAEEQQQLMSSNVVPATGRRRRVPLISHVQAGWWVDATDSYEVGQGTEFLDVDFAVSDRTFALEIKGESMLPEYVEGDRVIIDPAITPVPGDLVVAKNSSDSATFKKYRPRGINERGEQVFELVPLNPDYPTLFSDREPITVIGVMVEHRRRRRRSGVTP